MTEAEALTKWCPFVRFTPATSEWRGFNNRAVAIKEGSTTGDVAACIGSACMAWRWGKVLRCELDGVAVSGWQDKDAARLVTVRDGFCGLAGEVR